jgi:hypothetical protein
LEMGGRCLMNYFPRLASNLHPPNLSLPSSKDYRHEPPAPGLVNIIIASILQMREPREGRLPKILQLARVQSCLKVDALNCTVGPSFSPRNGSHPSSSPRIRNLTLGAS